MKALIIYASIDGQTKKISQYMQQKLANADTEVQLIAIDAVQTKNLVECDYIILGASIRYGKYNKKVYKFIRENKQLLEQKANAFFTVNMTARKRGKDNPLTNSYVKKLIKKSNWQPQKMAIFAGKINYVQYDFFDRTIIRLIMKLTQGPTDINTNIEFTNWQKVDDFCVHLLL